MKLIVLRVAAFIWGLPQNLLGMILAFSKERSNDFRTAIVSKTNYVSGLSLGLYIFLPEQDIENEFLLKHEYGHTMQSFILGPLYLLIIGFPSLLWNRVRFFRNIRAKFGKDYYSFFTEKWANHLAAQKKHP